MLGGVLLTSAEVMFKSIQPENSLQRSMEAHMVKVHDIAIYKCAYCENVAFKKKSEFIKVTKFDFLVTSSCW